MDWNSFKYIEMISKVGTLSKAAQVLGLNQSTLSRNLQKFENEQSIKVFSREGNRYIVTPEGSEIVKRAEDFKRAVDSFEFSHQGNKSITVTSIDSFFSSYLLKRMTKFKSKMEFIETSKNLDLSKREADIAIRFGRPQSGDLLISKLCSVGYAIYSNQAFAVTPKKPLKKCQWVSLNRKFEDIDEVKWLRNEMGNIPISFRTSSYPQMVSLIEQGLCIGILPCYVGDPLPSLARYFHTNPILQREVWLAVHSDLTYRPNVKEFKNALIKLVTQDKDILAGIATA